MAFTTPVSANLRATPGINCITLTWNAEKNTTGLIGYNIYRKALLENFRTINTSPVSGITYKDTAVKAGITYYYNIRPVYVGAASKQASAAPAAPKIPVKTPFRR